MTEDTNNDREFEAGGKMMQKSRKRRRMTQEQLAEKIGLESNSVSRIERGTTPSFRTFISICNSLGVSSAEILSPYIEADAPHQWTPLAEKLSKLDLAKQRKIEKILDCLIDTL